jgi:hypothetical protein
MAKEIGYHNESYRFVAYIGPEQTADILEFMSFSIRNHSEGKPPHRDYQKAIR